MTSRKIVSAHAVAAVTLFDMRVQNGAPLFLNIGNEELNLLRDLGAHEIARSLNNIKPLNYGRPLGVVSAPCVKHYEQTPCEGIEEIEDQAKHIRARLGAKLFGGDCVGTFHRAVLAYQDKPDLSRRHQQQQLEVLNMANLIIGNERILSMG